jgi:Ca2+-binding EF-hand superfamily protein
MVQAMFRNLDKDGNGELSIQEILEGLVAQGVQVGSNSTSTRRASSKT